MESEKIERKIAHERLVDKSAEKAKKYEAEVAPPSDDTPVVPIGDEAAPVSVPQDEELAIIKSILSENLVDIYYQLPFEVRADFRKRGEEAANKIRKILMQAKVKAHEILEIILNWLKSLPRISRYFLEQEAKIKADKILKMKMDGQIIEK
jgi:hypothetical protein